MTLAPGTFAGLAGPECELFKKVLAGRIGEGVEIGCMDGYSTAHILDYSDLTLTSIDPFIPDSMESSLIGTFEKWTANVAPWSERAKIRRDYSWNVAKTWSQPLDFIFIDGDHTYDAVKLDYYNWTPFLVKGGLLAVHDARMGRPRGANFHDGPSRMAREHIFDNPAWEIVGEAYSLVVAKNTIEPPTK